MKLCKWCNEYKDIEKFQKKSSAKDGLQTYCKLCTNKNNKIYRFINNERIISYTNLQPLCSYTNRYIKSGKKNYINS